MLKLKILMHTLFCANLRLENQASLRLKNNIAWNGFCLVLAFLNHLIKISLVSNPFYDVVID